MELVNVDILSRPKRFGDSPLMPGDFQICLEINCDIRKLLENKYTTRRFNFEVETLLLYFEDGTTEEVKNPILRDYPKKKVFKVFFHFIAYFHNNRTAKCFVCILLGIQQM
jgi:hypothetical protein